MTPEEERKVMATMEIMKKLEALNKKGISDSNGNELLIGGTDSYIHPEKFASLAEKNRFRLYKSFPVDDERMVDEAQRIIESGKMVIVAAYTGKEDRIDLFLEPEYPKAPSNVSKGGCFIATATYGSPFAPEVLIFRRFRDEVLLTSNLGHTLVEIYYWASPPLARIILKTRFLKIAARYLLLEPISQFLKITFRY